MKAVVLNDDDPPSAPCVVYWTGRKGLLSVNVITYCGDTRDAGSGVAQVPDDVKCCEECERAVKDKRYPTGG